MKFLTQLGTELYFLAIHIAAFWNPKAKLFVDGRKNSWKLIQSFKRNESSPLYWFHCASLGEFEQARPLIEQFKNTSECQIVITFFSPSGYEIRKNYQGADLILYLPKDSKKNALKFLNTLKPDTIFFVKYEFWPHYLLQAQLKNIPTYLISAVFRQNQVFFKWYGGYMRQVLGSFNGIFLQNPESKPLLDQINIKSSVCGDTRYDRVMENAKQLKSFPEIKAFVQNKPCLVIGSSWEVDEEILFPILNKHPELKIIIAPHEINESHLSSIEKNYQLNSIRYSKINEVTSYENYQMLIIDNIGMLMHLYQYGQLAYIGGAFGKGLHNILEAAAFGLPVIFGPKHSKFPEANLFIQNQIGFSISHSNEFQSHFDRLIQQNNNQTVLNFMASHTGATSCILKQIKSIS